MSVLIPFPNRWNERRSFRAQRKKSGFKDELTYYHLVQELGMLSDEVTTRKEMCIVPEEVRPYQERGRAEND
jgi:hypothetical protein